MPFSTKDNQVVRDYKSVPEEERELTEEEDEEDEEEEGASSDLLLVLQQSTVDSSIMDDDKRGSSAGGGGRIGGGKYGSAEERLLSKVAEAEAEAEQQLLRVSTTFVDTNEEDLPPPFREGGRGGGGKAPPPAGTTGTGGQINLESVVWEPPSSPPSKPPPVPPEVLGPLRNRKSTSLLKGRYFPFVNPAAIKKTNRPIKNLDQSSVVRPSSNSNKSIRSRSNRARRFVLSCCSRSMWRKRAKNFIPILLFLVYSASGGLMFWLLEGRGRQAKADQERAVRDELKYQIRNETIGKLIELIERNHRDHVRERMEIYNYSEIDAFTNILYSLTNSDNSMINSTTIGSSISSTISTNISIPSSSPSSSIVDLRQYVDTIVDALNHSFVFRQTFALDSLLINFSRTLTPLLDEHDRRDWTFWGSIFYCGTIYTTIGYGYMTANTNLGRALTIAYALLGIPLVLYNLSQLGRWLMKAIWKCYIGTARLMAMCRGAEYRQRARLLEREREMAEFPFWIAIAITCGWTLMCSAIFSELENWDFFTSFYFFFQSLTTIGFGDIKPNRPEYLVWSFLLILIGLALVSMCWSLLQMKFDRLITAATKKIAEQFVHTEFETDEDGGDGNGTNRMALDAHSIEHEIEKITSNENSFLANLVSDNRRRALVNEWRKVAKKKNKACQTRIFKLDDQYTQTDNSEESTQTNESGVSTAMIANRWTMERPYRETRRQAIVGTGTSSSAHSTPFRHSNDEFRNLLQGLKTILGECQETLSSSRDLTISSSGVGSGVGTTTIMGVTLTPVRRGGGGGTNRGGRSQSESRASSTVNSASMVDA